MSDIFAIYKPKGMTSHDVVDKIRKITNVKRVGHGGTLDPLAEGVLIIAVGRENTKNLEQYVKGDKEYVATLKLGFESETDDSEGPIKEVSDIRPTTEDIKKTLEQFIGTIEQTPSAYSAIKINGREAYKRIRVGETFEMKTREVRIEKIEFLKYEYPELEIRVSCGSGVYIRTLARDIGERLGTGAYLTKLIRTRVGEFKIEDSLKIEELKID